MICGGYRGREKARNTSMVTGEYGECYALKNKQWKHLFNLKLTKKNPYAGTGDVNYNFHLQSSKS